jgi:molecular chaperone HtpG
MALEDPSKLSPHDVKLGKDILELVSSAMYVDPLTTYREYVQNAADAIDQARAAGLLSQTDRGSIAIDIDNASRSVRIRDNGIGVPPEDFNQRLLALGGSTKRGAGSRGFRGVGRLAGLAYAQEIIFRSRVEGQADVSEMIWDCRQLKSSLADPCVEDIASLVASIVQVRRVPGDGAPKRFFEVELSKVLRQRGDPILDAPSVADYLTQVAPVPFAEEFRYGAEIASAIRAAIALSDLDISINGGLPLLRPHGDTVPLGNGRSSVVEGLTIIEVPALDGGLAAIAWFLHHAYEGAIPAGSLIKGLRLRVGNLQVGGHSVLEAIFPESRFNSWAVGEIHVIDPRLIPNGRRDEFEHNAHLANLMNQLAPTARDIARRCRTSSARRSKLREFEAICNEVSERIAILSQGGLGEAAWAMEAVRTEQAIARGEKVASMQVLDTPTRELIGDTMSALRVGLEEAAGESVKNDPLALLSEGVRARYQEMFALIYECSVNRVAAKALVDRILAKIASAGAGSGARRSGSEN